MVPLALETRVPRLHPLHEPESGGAEWPPEKCQLLAGKSFESLKPGGRLIVHEMLYDDRKTGPFATAAMNINMLLWYDAGRQYSGRELSAILTEAGFSEIEVMPTFGYYSIVVGRKPG
jgi:O-methyltransferase domain